MYDTHSGATLFRVNVVYMNTFRPTEEKLARENKLPGSGMRPLRSHRFADMS